MKVKKNSRPSHIKWLLPGMGVKRWLIALAMGAALLGLGVVYSTVMLYREGILPRSIYRILTIQFLPSPMRAALAMLIGCLISIVAYIALSRTVFSPFLETGGAPLADAVYQHRKRKRGPSIVAIGGGTGLATLLRGLKHHTDHLSAIITVADDGGSSGRLRRELGLPPPGDFRNCIAALADDESLTTQLMQYRFGLSTYDPEKANGELVGHSFGNLFIAAMTGITGSFESGLEQSSNVLAIKGQILPSTLANVTLVADVREQKVRRVAGESHIPKAAGVIERVYLLPEHPPAYPAAVRAILTADIVILGPGSLFTSVLPNLLVRGIHQALANTRAPVIYICNVACQKGETDGFDANDHLDALERHIGNDIIDIMIINNHIPENHRERIEYVRPEANDHVQVVAENLVDNQNPRQHDSEKLAEIILSMH
ncbi:MAG: YvcK family protein [Anaerolineales bacterium]|nr:YvcK family protein [Anaerolineales bacterium]